MFPPDLPGAWYLGTREATRETRVWGEVLPVLGVWLERDQSRARDGGQVGEKFCPHCRKDRCQTQPSSYGRIWSTDRPWPFSDKGSGCSKPRRANAGSCERDAMERAGRRGQPSKPPSLVVLDGLAMQEPGARQRRAEPDRSHGQRARETQAAQQALRITRGRACVGRGTRGQGSAAS